MTIDGRLRVPPRVVCPWVKVDAPLLEDGPPMSDSHGRSEGEVVNEKDGTQDEVTDGVTDGVTGVVTDGGHARAPKGAGKYLV